MNAVFLSIVTFFSTSLGGAFALRHNDRLHYILSFTAGVLIGVVSFDLLPEIFEQAHENAADPMNAMIALVAGFLLFHSLEKFVLVHHSQEGAYTTHRHPHVGILSACALICHSVMDGIGIGLAGSLMGISGGSLSNIVLTLYGKTIHQAVATSAGLGVPITIVGTIGYILAGLHDR